MATHSSIVSWGIPCTEEPRGLQSLGWQELDTTERLSTQTPSQAHSLIPESTGGAELQWLTKVTLGLESKGQAKRGSLSFFTRC